MTLAELDGRVGYFEQLQEETIAWGVGGHGSHGGALRPAWGLRDLLGFLRCHDAHSANALHRGAAPLVTPPS